jgi:hypothetical protein
MFSSAIAVRCGGCSRELAERPGGSMSARQQCPACGSLSRRVSFRSTEAVRARLAPNEHDDAEERGDAEESESPAPSAVAAAFWRRRR